MVSAPHRASRCFVEDFTGFPPILRPSVRSLSFSLSLSTRPSPARILLSPSFLSGLVNFLLRHWPESALSSKHGTQTHLPSGISTLRYGTVRYGVFDQHGLSPVATLFITSPSRAFGSIDCLLSHAPGSTCVARRLLVRYH
eukprot:4708843-Pleurochrysis_carterae.AAC.3